MFKKVLLNSIIIFVLSTLIHFLYDSLPFFITSIFAPVNESIFEHMKLIFSSYMLFLLIQILFKKSKKNNHISSFVISALINIFIFLIIYLPINAIIGKEIMFITLTIYFITIVASNYILIRIQERKNNDSLKNYAIISIIIIYIIFTILTYYPLKIDLFLDKETNTYGIANPS